MKVIPVFLLCLLLVAALSCAGCSSRCGGFHLYRIDEPNPPEGKIIHLKGGDFSAFSDFGSKLRNPHVYQQNMTLTINGTKVNASDLGSVHVSCNEQWNKYDSLSGKYLEYRGNLYYFGGIWVY